MQAHLSHKSWITFKGHRYKMTLEHHKDGHTTAKIKEMDTLLWNHLGVMVWVRNSMISMRLSKEASLE